MNNQIKRELVNKILELSKIQQNEILNIIKKEKINYSSNNNGVFINLTKLDIGLINKINSYIDYLKNNYMTDSKKKSIEILKLDCQELTLFLLTRLFNLPNLKEFVNRIGRGSM